VSSEAIEGKLKSVGETLLGLILYAVTAVVILLLTSIYLYGVPRVSAVVYRIASPLSGIALLIDILCLPLALLKRARSFVGTVWVISSFVFGVILWTYSAVVSYLFWGYLGLFVGLIWLGVGVVPVAFLAAALHASWAVVANIILALILTFGARFLGMALGGQN